MHDDGQTGQYSMLFYSIWRISLHRLRDIWKTGPDWRKITTHEGYGETVCRLAPLQELEAANAAVLWWGERYKGPTIKFGGDNA